MYAVFLLVSMWWHMYEKPVEIVELIFKIYSDDEDDVVPVCFRRPKISRIHSEPTSMTHPSHVEETINAGWGIVSPVESNLGQLSGINGEEGRRWKRRFGEGFQGETAKSVKLSEANQETQVPENTENECAQGKEGPEERAINARP